MKAYVYGGKGALGVKEIQEPSLTDDNAVIKVLAASVCGECRECKSGHTNMCDNRRTPYGWGT